VVYLYEPTAGLDPEASRTVHQFITELRSEGRTIFLTTHNLPEADELCDLIGVFRTRLVQVGTPAHLRATLFGTGTIIKVADEADKWISTAKALPFVHEVSAQNGVLSIKLDDPDVQNPSLVQALASAGAPIRYVEPFSHTLEDVYLQLIEEGEAK
jgi:ABC-2 type transport system ATP-binding protein